MNTTKRILFLLMIIGLYSCENKTTTDKFVFDSSTPVCTDKTMLSSIIDIKNIIPLETNDYSIIGDIGKILKYKDKIYILYNRKTVLVFNDKGRFIQQIGSLGAGPGEYQLIGDFDVTDENIYIRDYQKIQRYNLDGSYVSSITFDVNLFGINVVKDKILGFVTNDNKVSHIFTTDGKLINKYHPESKAATIGTSNYYWPLEEDLYLFPFVNSNDALAYNTKNNEYNYMKLIDLPDMLTLDDINHLNENGTVYNIREKGRVVWPFNSNTEQAFCITPKGIEKGILWIKDKDSKVEKAFDREHIINDISFTNIQSFFSCFTRSEDSFIAYIMPYELKEALQQEKERNLQSDFHSRMKDLANSLSEEDNPILIEYEFK